MEIGWEWLRLTHTSGLSYGCGFGEEPSDATETGYAKLVNAVDQGSVRTGEHQH